jgi:hypothetical protein
LEIVGCEHGDLEQVEEVASALERVPVQLHAVTALGLDLGLQQLDPPVVDNLGAQDRGRGTGTNEGRVGDAPERLPCRGPTHRFQQARLALGVRAADHRHPGWELELRVGIAAEVL